MPKTNTYRDIQASLMRFCKEFAEEFGLEFVNLDAHTDESQWPEGDFIGMGELSMNIMETDEVMVSFAISTRDDVNLFRMGELINLLVDRLMPNSSITVYDAISGYGKFNLFVTEGTRVEAPFSTKTQPIQAVTVRLLGDRPNV